ncbi:hypothetical protein [Anaerospora sp.]|uniref:hypothetical protein n=1 Tax=Anaerospora sp. TaxID=1960278 RepID=UPI0028A22625|nr:hypothetical protein [Anaerospora sp.]
MKLFIWVHDRTFHSWSMMNEPVLHEAMYSRAAAVVVAETEQEAIQLLLKRDSGWRQEDLERLRPQVMNWDTAQVVYSHIQ